MKPSSLKLAAVDLVDREGVPTCPSTAIAEHCGITHQAVLKLIDCHRSSIETAFGHIGFEISKPENQQVTIAGPGRPPRIAYLTEQQATFLITMLRNTDVVVRFKLALTQAFFVLRDRRENVAYVGLFLQEVPAAWEGTFPDSFFRAVCDCYGLHYVKGKTPGFFGGFINRYIYEPLLENLSPELKAKREEYCDACGMSEASFRLHQFLRKHCKKALERHILVIETLLAVSRTEMDFKEHFAARFEGRQQLVLEFQTKAQRKKALKKLPA
jgi:hypothetical protein